MNALPSVPETCYGPETASDRDMTDNRELPIFSAALAEHLQKPPPEFLYHYTTQRGLLGIVDSRSLWATNISHLNDSTEFDLSLGLIRESLSKGNDTSDAQAKRYATTDPQRAKTATLFKDEQSRLWRLATRVDYSDICVTCFCADGDLLSQWRGYTGGGYGFSLAFDPQSLKALASNAGFMLGKCIYDTDLQNRIINESLEYLLTKGQPGDRVDIKDYVAVVRYGAFFKHKSFKQEQEWRLVSTRITETRFREGKSTIIPYTTLSISSLQNLGLNHAIIGPCPHKKLSKVAVERLFEERNIDAFVKKSCVPFRDW
jgi:hypothetical protein